MEKGTIVIDLDDTALDDIELTSEQVEAMKKVFKWSIAEDLETGAVKLLPLNEEKTIALDKEENVIALIEALKSTLNQKNDFNIIVNEETKTLTLCFSNIETITIDKVRAEALAGMIIQAIRML